MIVLSSNANTPAPAPRGTASLEAVHSSLSLGAMVMLLVMMAAMVIGAALTLPVALLAQRLFGRHASAPRRGWQAVTA